MPRFKAALLLSLATLCAPAFGQSANPAVPGTLNYVEGHAAIDGQAISQRAVGQATLEPGQSLSTATGKAELLLTPGVFLRLDDNSTVTMVSPSLTDTVVKLDRGRADVEVDQLYKQNEIVIAQKGGESQLLKGGLYEFNATANTMRVFDGKAAVFEGAQQPMSAEGGALTGKPVEVKAGHELALTGDSTKSSFNKAQSQSTDELYNWSSLRSQYLGEANINLAYGYGGVEGFAPGWFWDAGLYGYTWLPGGGPFFSPFGWGFYSPAYLYGGGLIYGRGGYGYRGGYYGGAARSVGSVRGFSGGSGFHGGGGGGRR
jgi:hypothetical protein